MGKLVFLFGCHQVLSTEQLCVVQRLENGTSLHAYDGSAFIGGTVCTTIMVLKIVSLLPASRS